MRIVKKIALPIAALIAFNNTAQADSNIMPQYLPGGSIPTMSLSDVFSPITNFKQPSWWYLVGNMHDQNNAAHSLQAQITSFNILGNTAGLGQIGFTFTDALGHDDYLWNVYPSSQMLPNYSVGKFNYIDANNRNFNVRVSSNPGNDQSPFLFSFAHNGTDLHTVGQIGAQYTMQAIGTAEVGVASNNPELVKYQLNLVVQDQRGLVGEGFNGYVGGIKADDTASGVDSWEFAMPNMRVLSWSMTISPDQKTNAQSPVQQTLSFQNNSMPDTIWLDRQALYNPTVDTTIPSTQSSLAGAINDAAKPMYNGTWMAFCFNQGALKGVCGDAVAFWNDNTATNLMDSDINAHGGFINIFTPDSNGTGFPVTVGSTQTEELSFSNGNKDLPFTIKNDPSAVFTSPISHHQYAQTAYVTIKKNTAFSGLFDMMSHQLGNDHAYVLKFVAISPLTENIPGDNNGGYYEGAANVYLCTNGDQTCSLAGTGFVEQMGYGS